MERKSLRALRVLGSAGLLLTVGCGKQEPAHSPAEPTTVAAQPTTPRVQVGQVVEVAADDTLAVTGSIFAGTEVNVASKVGGKVIAIGADDGARVPAGRVLVRLDSAAAQTDVRRAQAALSSARASLEKVRINQEMVEVQSETAVRSAEEDLRATRARLAQAIEAEKIARTQSGSEGVNIAQAKANVAAAESRLAQARTSQTLTEQTVTADIDAAASAVAQAESGYRQAQTAVSQARSALQLTDTSTQTMVATARQAVLQAEQGVSILQTGSRDQERAQASSRVDAARVAVKTAQIEHDRVKFLFDNGAVAKAQFDNASLMLDVRKEDLRQAEAALSLVQEGPRPQEVRIGQSQLTQAQDQLKQAEAQRERELELRREDLKRAEAEQERASEAIKAAQAQHRKAQAAREQVALRERDLEQARVALTQAQENLRLAEAGVGQAEIARQDVRAAETAVAAAEQRLRTARSNLAQPRVNRQEIANLQGVVRQQEAMVASTQIHLNDHVVIAPLGASVAEKAVEVGEVVSPGQRLYRLVSDTFVHFDALVPEEKVRFVQIGGEVDVAVDAVPGKTFGGRVLEILPAADLRSRTFTVKIGVENEGRLLREGMFARGLLILAEDQKRTCVPPGAVVRRDDQDYVIRIDSGSRATPVPVELGTTVQGMTEITKGDLMPGDRIVVEGGSDITEPTQVQIIGETGETGSPSGEAPGGSARGGETPAPAPEPASPSGH